jgi:ADP-L-glycero-D-manno-heptose 6-epimerase
MDKILITGAAGFIGSRLCDFYKDKFEVMGVDTLEHFKSRSRSYAYPKQLIDKNALFEQLPTLSVKAVFHIGACTKTTELNREYLTQNNVEYSKKLWKFCTESNIPFIYASSAATYGNGQLGFSDNDEITPKLKPLNPYGESKHQFDLWVLEQTKAPPLWSGFKFFNVFGYGEQYKGNMASVAHNAFFQIQKNKKMKLFKSENSQYDHGYQVRDFVWVEDILEVLDFAFKNIKSGLYNLGTGQPHTFLDVANALFSAMNLEPQIEFIELPENLKNIYQYYTCADMNKLRRAGYRRAFTPLKTAINTFANQLVTA